MTVLLNIDGNPKTVKGQKLGFLTAILYLTPYLFSGTQLCPMAKLAGCWLGCLNVQGHGGIAKRGDVIATDAGPLPNNSVQRARLSRTALFNTDKRAFFSQLIKELRAFIARATRKGLTPTIRLNGTSDIQWENLKVFPKYTREDGSVAIATIFDIFPDVQFYDYTKIVKRVSVAYLARLPANYHLSLSYSEATKRYANACVKAHKEENASLVIVVRNLEVKERFLSQVKNAVDGDAHDLRFFDKRGSIVVLKAKGTLAKDDSGFVVDTIPAFLMPELIAA